MIRIANLSTGQHWCAYKCIKRLSVKERNVGETRRKGKEREREAKKQKKARGKKYKLSFVEPNFPFWGSTTRFLFHERV